MRESSTNARKRRMKILRNIHTYFWLTILGAIFTIPFLWLLTTSFKPNDRIQRWPPDIIPMQHVRVVVDGKSRKVYDMDGQKVALMGSSRWDSLSSTHQYGAMLQRTDSPL